MFHSKNGSSIIALMGFIVPYIILIIIISILLESISMYIGIKDTWIWAKSASSVIIIIAPIIVPIGTLSGGYLQLFWLDIVAIITISIILVLIQSIAIVHKNGTRDINRTSIYWVSILFSSMMSINLIISLISSAVGYPIVTPGSLPTNDSPEALFIYADASVWEEVISRMFLIGIPMFFLGLLHKNISISYLFGGFGLGIIPFFFLIISSILFGFAHIDGWGISKIIPAIIGGLMMGYLYIRFGIHVSIVFHFLVDYSVILINSIGAFIVISIILLCTMFGILCTIYLISETHIQMKRVIPYLLYSHKKQI